MARKVNTDKIKEKMAKLKEKIVKCQEELTALQSDYDELETQLNQAETEQLIQFMRENNLTVDQVKEQLMKKEG